MSNEYQGGYTRRQELTCTEAQIAMYADLVLHENEKIYVRMNSGVIRMKLGDGVTGLRDLPYTKVFDGTLEEVEAMLDSIHEDYTALAEAVAGKFDKANIAQGLGDSEEKVLSQKAVTREFYTVGLELGKTILVRGAEHFTNPVYLTGGTQYEDASRFTCDLVRCDNYKYICFTLNGFRDTTKNITVLTFFDENKEYLSELVYNPYGDFVVSGKYPVPDGAVYVCGSWYVGKTATPCIYGIGEKGDFIDLKTAVGQYDTETPLFQMWSFDDFSLICNKLNSQFITYGNLCKCHAKSFTKFTTDMSLEEFYSAINHNFRRKVCDIRQSEFWNFEAINAAFKTPVRRFQDAVINNTEGFVNSSINLNLPTGEPSALISPDNTIYLWCGFEYLYESVDGIHYTLKGEVNRNGGPHIIHTSINYSNGVYYAVGTSSDIDHLRAYKSTDGLNWEYIGIILQLNEEYNSNGDKITKYGNTFLWEEPNGKWYLIYEMIDQHTEHRGYELCLATSTDPWTNYGVTSTDGHRVVGVWEHEATNPIIPWTDSSVVDITNESVWHDTGNPEIARVNNFPVKVDGKYIMYYHGEFSTRIHRAYSYDLVNWVDEGVILDVRDMPTGDAISNADHCMIEYKGRTYMYYTHNINGITTKPFVRLLIEDRPMIEVLRDMP